MTAYDSLPFFAAVALLAVPAVVLGLTGRSGRPLKWWGLVATVVIVSLLFAHLPKQVGPFVGFLVIQVLVAKGHLWFVRTKGRDHPWERRLAVALALAPLAVAKLAGLVTFPSLGFLGISYLTFKAVQVVLETSDGLITELSLLDLLHFLAFFPTLTSGPIDRSRRFLQDLDVGHTRQAYARMLGQGLWWIVLGAFYKVVLAALFRLWRADVGTGVLGYVHYMYSYGFELFFDFAGYSLMAIGVSLVFGVRTPVNFRMPWLSESIKDFWNRWHITLSFWLRDFVYTRLVMVLMKRKVFARREHSSYAGYAVNMLAMGAWHGLTVHYVLYGGFHGALMIANDVYERRSAFYKAHRTKLWYRLVAIVVTAHLVLFSFLLFSGHLITF